MPLPPSDGSSDPSLCFRLPAPVIDQSGRVIAVLAGHPEAEDWEAVHLAAAQALEDARSASSFPSSSLEHRRGNFQALMTGVSIGNGQQQPSNLRNSRVNKKVVDELGNATPFQRLAGYSSGESA